MRSHIPQPESRRPLRREAFGSYRLRMLAALAFSLSLTLVCVHLPISEASQRVGWYLTHSPPLTLDVVDVAGERGGGILADAPPVTHHDVDAPIEVPPAGDDTDEPLPLSPPPPPQPMVGRALLVDYDVGSRIVGGMGAYYIHIDYPVEAIRDNVQGRLMLHFTVDRDGRATDIFVARSLHPLCDSAAVAALRQTRFIPAHEDGKPVPIRMKLPVRFQIVDSPSVAQSAGLRED